MCSALLPGCVWLLCWILTCSACVVLCLYTAVHIASFAAAVPLQSWELCSGVPQRKQVYWGARSERGAMHKTNLWGFQKLGGTVVYLRTAAHHFLKWCLFRGGWWGLRFPGFNHCVKVLAEQTSEGRSNPASPCSCFCFSEAMQEWTFTGSVWSGGVKTSPGNARVPARTVKFWDNICSAVSSWQKSEEMQQSWGSIKTPTSQSCVVIGKYMINHVQICRCWRSKISWSQRVVRH